MFYLNLTENIQELESRLRVQSLEILQTNALQKRSQKCAEFSENADTLKKKILTKTLC